MSDRRASVPGIVALLCVLCWPQSAISGPNLPPAPYKQLPVGTVLDYGWWRCEIAAGRAFETVCVDSGRQTQFLGKFIVFGRQDNDGYGGAIPEVPLVGYRGNPSYLKLEEIWLAETARKKLVSLWPLAMGKKTRFVLRHGQNPESKIDVAIEVIGTERHKIAKRERNLYVVRATNEVYADLTTAEITGNFSPTTYDVPPYVYVQTWWYDPEDGIVVKANLEWKAFPVPGYGYSYQLKDVRFPKPAATSLSSIGTVSPASRTKNEPQIANSNAAQKSETRQVSAEEKRLARIREEQAQIAEQQRREVERLRRLIAEAEAKAERLAALQQNGSANSNPNVPAYIKFGSYHALVIGIDNYTDMPRLQTAVEDANAVADVLESKYGFKVTKLIDPSREDILDALDQYRETLKFTDNLLIYYAGHGWLDQKADVGYWLPANAKKNRRSRWVSNATITATLKAIESKHVMVVSDSCYSGRLVRSAAIKLDSNDTPEYLQKMSRKKARVVITSGGLEPVEDGKGLHSPFARAFLQALNDNDGVIDGTRLFAAIRRPVMVNANQTPQYSDVRRAGHDGGEFLFVRRN